MKPADIDRVFGRGRLRMVTGDHVEVFREESQPGERRRYTKRFLATAAGDFSEWTGREWRILARLVGHGIKPVPDVVSFDRGAADRAALVQTYDAGVTVDHWATLLPLERDGTTLRNVFEDCAHWWALARHSLIALDAIHELQLVHLDLKADNVCIPVGPSDFDPHARGGRLQPRFEDIALIDFAFSLVSGERLDSALPIAQQADYEYQSPRLLSALEAGRHGDLAPTRQLDWRCDLFSLAAMLWRYLPELEATTTGAWTRPRHAKARALVRRLIEAHDAELPARRPHAELIALAAEALAAPDMVESLRRGWTLAFDSRAPTAASPTPVTRIALPVTSSRVTAVAPLAATSAPAVAPFAPAFFASSAVPVRATPSFAAAKENGPTSEPLAVDPTDVAMRMQSRRQMREQRARRLAWAGGLGIAAVVATAAVAWLEPAWQPGLGTPEVPGGRADAALPSARRDAPIVAIAAPQTPARIKAGPAPAAPNEEATRAADGVHEVAPAAPLRRAGVEATQEGETLGTLDADAKTTSAGSVDAKAAAPIEVTAPAATRSPSPAPAATPSLARTKEPARTRVAAAARPAEAVPLRQALARHARTKPAAMPFPAPSRLARHSAPALVTARPAAARAPRGTLTMASRRPAAANPWPASGTPIPWAVAGRGAARYVLAKASGESGALQPAPVAAPTALAVVARPTLSADPAPAANASTTPPSVPPAQTASDDAPIDYAARASELMASQVPRLAQRAERLVARVLFVAGRSERAAGDDEIRVAAGAIGRDGADTLAAMPVSAREADRLGEAARAEYARRGGTPEALALQARAFGANPLDVEAAGNLAFLLLRQRPAQPEAARQLALHALSLHGARYPQGRIEDWATFAIASALAGRDRDARNAFLVMLALAPNLERQCKAALDVYAIYGERLRAPVESMLQSANASGRANGSAFCEWPPHWVVSGASR